MKKQYASILLTLTCVLGLGVGAEGQSQREVIVTVPYEFVAGGKTLPAGTYTVTRVSEDRFGGLIISSYENRSSVVVMPNEFEGYPSDNIKVSFKQIGDVHFLTRLKQLTVPTTYRCPIQRLWLLE